MKEKQENLGPLIHALGTFFGLIIPLIFWLASKTEDNKKNVKSLLNWQLSQIVYFIAFGIFIVIGFAINSFWIVLIGVLLILSLIVLAFVLGIVGAVKSSKKVWVYPVAIPFLKI